jgi:multicomponent K+:H+ antiporter subunit A
MQQRVQNAYDIDHPERQMGDTIADYLMVPSVIMRMLFPVIATMAVFLLLRGHDLPGGGFVAGLTMAVGIILQYMAGGATWIETRFRISPVRWMAVGLLFATATGAGAWLVGYPFLTSHMFDINLPVIGVLHLSSVYLFDLGVFSLVFGATVLMLIALAHQSLRSHRRPKAAASEAIGRE